MSFQLKFSPFYIFTYSMFTHILLFNVISIYFGYSIYVFTVKMYYIYSLLDGFIFFHYCNI